MRLAQEIRNAFDARSRDALEVALVQVDALERATPKPALICTRCGVNRLERPCGRPDEHCPVKGMT